MKVDRHRLLAQDPLREPFRHILVIFTIYLPVGRAIEAFCHQHLLAVALLRHCDVVKTAELALLKAAATVDERVLGWAFVGARQAVGVDRLDGFSVDLSFAAAFFLGAGLLIANVHICSVIAIEELVLVLVFDLFLVFARKFGSYCLLVVD